MAREPFNPDLIPEPPKQPSDAGSSGPVTVTQLTAMVKRAIESVIPATVHVVGEISNFRRHSSGHLYFTLKDRASELSCVMWRSTAAKLKFDPADGLEVIATGSVEVFERAGRYQLYARKLEPRGVGALELAFRQLHAKLNEEGLFDDRHKKELPAYPRRIVLVTSPTGAALGDMCRTIERRYPCVHVLVYPVRVQGEGAAGEVAAAIRNVNKHAADLGGVDVMIVGRGGGSIEDLWAFNEEIVARAIHASGIPIISAVGHEVDVTIADLVADVRAATPTAAAELAVPVLDDVLANLAAVEADLTRMLTGKTRLHRAQLDGIVRHTAFREPMRVVRIREQIIDELTNRLRQRVVRQTTDMRRRLDQLEQVVERIAPHHYLLHASTRLHETQQRLHAATLQRMNATRGRQNNIERRLERVTPTHQVRLGREKLRAAAGVLPVAMRHKMTVWHESLRRGEDLLTAMSYRSVLGRGFSITRSKKGRRVVRSVRDLDDRQRIVTELADGEFEADVVNLKQLELFD